MEKKGLYDCKTQIIKLICGFRFKSTIFLFDSTQTVAAWSIDFLFNYLLVYWSSLFFVAGWQAFGISLAWVEHIPALFQFWSGDILHCHLGGGKLKQPFFYELLRKSFSTNLTWFLFPSMLQFAAFLLIASIAWLLSVCSISVLKQFLFESGKKNPEIGLILPWLCDWFRNLTPLSNQTQN